MLVIRKLLRILALNLALGHLSGALMIFSMMISLIGYCYTNLFIYVYRDRVEIMDSFSMAYKGTSDVIITI